VGSIGVFVKDDVYRKSAEIGYWLGEPYWGRGIMTDAIRQMCRMAFERFDIVRIFAEPFAYNAGSMRALEKAGFTLEGVHRMSVFKNGQFYDSCTYALLLDDLADEKPLEIGEKNAVQPAL
jgi:ribosomal-protein-alanine N-acetyltransferase